MLRPEYLERLPRSMVELYAQVEADILADMARRISTYEYWIPAADHQYRAAIEMGNVHDAVMDQLSGMSMKSRAELERLMEEAGREALAFDSELYQAHGLAPPALAASKELQAVLRSGLAQTNGLFTNLTRTTANTASKQFEDALDRAWLQVSSGAFDYGAAIRTAVKDLSRQGVGAIRYPTGHVDMLEVAVRRATVTGVNQTALKLQEALADEMDSDLVEVTAHAGARPSHAEWQGGVYSRSGKSRTYGGLREATGYGTGEGLGGWNCRHSFFPYFEGSPRTYTPKLLRSYEAESCTYNGRSMTEYEASQRQRYIERQIRRWKRENTAMSAAGLDTSESAAKIAQWQETQRDFLRQTGLKRQGEREIVGETLASGSKSAIIKAESGGAAMDHIASPIERRHTGKGAPNAILHFDIPLNTRQLKLLEQLDKFDSRVTVSKSAVGMSDLAALTAATGQEFALFTKGTQRLVIRGNGRMVNIDEVLAERLAAAGFRWSGHTHPGSDKFCLIPSDGDKLVLECFHQEQSAIYNSAGQWIRFDKEGVL